MSYPPNFYTQHVRHQELVAKERRIVQEYPPEIPSWDREALFSSFGIYGQPGCLSKDEVVYTPNGVVTAQEVVNGTEIMGGYAQGIHCYNTELLEVRFRNGIKMVVSPEHPFFTRPNGSLPSRGRWMSAEEMSHKQHLKYHPYVQFYHAAHFKVNTVSIGEDWAELLGYLASDGCLAKGQTIKFTNTRERLLSRVEVLATKVGLHTTRYKKGNGFDILLSVFSRGGNKSEHDKHFQKSWLRRKLEQLRVASDTLGNLQLLEESEAKRFLAAFFNGDGSMRFRRSNVTRTGRSHVEVLFWVGHHRRIAYELQFLLWRLRLISNIHESRKGGWFVNVSRPQSCLELLSFLENKYKDERFQRAKSELQKTGMRIISDDNGVWISMSSIKSLGCGSVIGWQTNGSQEIIAACGMRTHNSGKTMANAFYAIQRFANLHKPELGVPHGMKIVCMDLLGKGEMAAVGIPITEKHPTFAKYTSLYGDPQDYPVQVFRPLVFTNGHPYLEYRQPNVVVPFTISLQDLTIEEWKSFLSPPTPSQERLHDSVLKELRGKPNWTETSLDDLYATAQGMLGARRPGFSRHIDGLEDADSIPLASHTYSSREAAGLLQRYEKLMDLGIIMPEQWGEKHVETNLDVRAMLETEVKWGVGNKTQSLWPISVFLLPDVEDAPFLNYALANYVLQRIFWLKHPNNRGRVTAPISIMIPEASKCVPREIRDKPKRHFIEPLKTTVIKLCQQAPGMGINVQCDAQRPMDLDEAFRDTNANLFIFDLGEEAAETIRELLRGRYVSNYKEITEENSRYLTALRERGAFIHIGIGSSYAELSSGCLCGFWYPRASGASGESETSFYSLYAKYKPNDWINIGALYSVLKVINLESQNRAAATMREMMAKEEEDDSKKKQKKLRNYERPEDRVVLGFILDLFKETSLDHWDSYEDFVKRLSEKASLPRSRIWQILTKFNGQYLMIDRTEGKKRQRVTLLMPKIQGKLNENTNSAVEE